MSRSGGLHNPEYLLCYVTLRENKEQPQMNADLTSAFTAPHL
jgi:hypothetical protein